MLCTNLYLKLWHATVWKVVEVCGMTMLTNSSFLWITCLPEIWLILVFSVRKQCLHLPSSLSSSRMDCVDKNVLTYFSLEVLHLEIHEFFFFFFPPCIESRGDWASWSTSPMPFCYRIWQVWNPDLVLLPISTGILEVWLNASLFCSASVFMGKLYSSRCRNLKKILSECRIEAKYT